MVARLEKTDHGYVVLLTTEMVEAMQLADGAAVQVLPADEDANGAEPQIRYLSVEEGMKIHREMEPFHADAYRELAK